MTHNGIYIKFMIEYDKANVTSSYPSLTEYEIATVLNKAYLALIAQKITGNNQRKVAFEYDTKAIEDLRPIITTTSKDLNITSKKEQASNDNIFNIPDDMLYIIQARLKNLTDYYNTTIINHQLAEGFMSSAHNSPWIENPVFFLEDEYFHVLVDPTITLTTPTLLITYIKLPSEFNTNSLTNADGVNSKTFELSNTMAEELINLAITMSLEIVESSRLQSKTSLLSLES